MNRILKGALTLFLAYVFSAFSALMIGPQMFVIVPVSIFAGILLAIRGSFLSLVLFGYPLSFGLIVTLIGCLEDDGYLQSSSFVVWLLIGVFGFALIAIGCWMSLPSCKKKVTVGETASDAR